MKKYIIALAIAVSIQASAANTAGYAWSESIGWFDFRNATITDTAVTGYAYNDNTGWLVLSGITNTNGTLSGYAWSESVGYFDFSHVTISNGALTGYAYNDNTGWLSFSTGTTVTTTWTLPVATPAVSYAGGAYYGGGSTSGGSYSVPESLKIPTTQPVVNTPAVVPNITPPTVTAIARDLQVNTKGADVKTLQQFLNSQGFIVSKTGAGSLGKETTLFGPATKAALIKFQAKNGIKPASGYFGPITRAFIKALLIKNN